MSSNPGDRRTRLLQMASGAVFLVIAVVTVLIVVNAAGDEGTDTDLEGAAEISRHLRGIPQSGLVLGDPKAPVELVEFGDLQCPACKAYSEEILPAVIDGPVKRGEAKIAYRSFAILGDQSTAAGAAALAAGAQGRGWHFVELFYRNQGREGSGYADDAFLKAVAEGAGVKSIRRWEQERAELEAEVEQSTAEAEGLGLEGTPSFAVQGPGTDGVEILDSPDSPEAIEEAIAEAG
jgi:protein-disulfide isomerase